MKRSAKIATAAAAAVVVIGGAVFGVVNASPQQTTIPADKQQVESKCGLAGTPGNPTELPVKWENVAGWWLPTSATDGPGVRADGGSWSCFSRTPSGAVLAAYVISIRANGVAEDWQTVVREQTLPGPGQVVKLDKTPTQTEPVIPRGFAVTAYSDTRATLTYVLHQGNLDASCNINVAWQDGDWRLVLEDDGGDSVGCTFSPPAAFIPWGPT